MEQIKTLSIDIETFSSVDLAKCGVYKYSESPDFEILLFGYSVNERPVQVVDVACGEEVPEAILAALADESVEKWAFNSAFERVCLSRWLRKRHPRYFTGYSALEDSTRDFLSPSAWRCSMVWVATMGLPLSLQGAGAVLGLEKQKLAEGKDLIKLFCQPCAPTKSNGGRARVLPADEPAKWEAFKRYNARDVETEMSIQARLRKFPVPDFVWDEYHIDQEINDRGVRIDLPLARQAIAMDARSRAELMEAMRRITELDNPNSVAQMKQWLAENGLETDTLGKKAVAELIRTVPPELQRVLALRLQLAKSSVKKYQAMANAVCADGRARGMFQFYGSRTGRWAGRLVQMQNLRQNHLPDLAEARALVRTGNYDSVEMLYEDVPDTLSQLVRTAFIPKDGNKFIVSDFSAIEARVIAWYAGEQWRLDLFARGGDIYCQSASQMFKVPVEKHGINGHLRQKGKIAELACIAEGQLVLTNHGEKPIETVTMEDLLWDGESWVQHEGVIYKGIREVITYEGLTATPDHLVWVDGEPEPLQFGVAAACCAHLIQTGDRGKALWLGDHYQPGKEMEPDVESLLCVDTMCGMRCNPVAGSEQSDQQEIERMPVLLTANTGSEMAGEEISSSKATVRKSYRSRVSELWRQRYTIQISHCFGRRSVPDQQLWPSEQEDGVGSDRHERALRTGEHSLCDKGTESSQPQEYCIERIRPAILALCPQCGGEKTVGGTDTGRDHHGRGNSSIREAKKLANHQCTARLYDIRNAGPHHRFTVSGHLVHNCGYGGSVGALKAMGAIDMGLTEDELPLLVDAWRQANPQIVKFWWAVDHAVMEAVRYKHTTSCYGLTFSCRSGMLFITLPSGRNLAYVKPKVSTNKFGGECITYEGVGATKKWERLESYGPKFVENIVQATARDILCYAMRTLRGCSIVMHVHDELVIEADPRMSLDAVCEQMGRTPPWAEGLRLRADGFTADFYKKD